MPTEKAGLSEKETLVEIISRPIGKFLYHFHTFSLYHFFTSSLFPLIIFMALILLHCHKDTVPVTPDGSENPEDKKQYCLYFDGQGDRVIVYDNNDAMDSMADAITLEAWISI